MCDSYINCYAINILTTISLLLQLYVKYIFIDIHISIAFIYVFDLNISYATLTLEYYTLHYYCITDANSKYLPLQ